MVRMFSRDQWRAFIDHPVVEWTLFVLGVILIIIGIITSPLPGPGGIFFAIPGLVLVLKTSLWAKRRYAKFKRWSFRLPKLKVFGRTFVHGRTVAPGRVTDLLMRRRSALRREQIRREKEEFERTQQTIAGD